MPTVLIAEDDRDLRELTAEFIRRAGYTVLTAADGEEALRLIEAHRPDLVLLDGVMPGLDGWQVLGQMTAAPASARTPVVFTSGCSHCVSRRADVVFLSKPLDLDRLLRTIRALVENPRRTPLAPMAAVADL